MQLLFLPWFTGAEKKITHLQQNLVQKFLVRQGQTFRNGVKVKKTFTVLVTRYTMVLIDLKDISK